MQNIPSIQGNGPLYIDNKANRERFKMIADSLTSTENTAALNRFKNLVEHMTIDTALKILKDDFPGLQLNEIPAAAEAGAAERPAAGASDTRARQIADDEEFAKEYAAAPPTVFAQPAAAGAAGVAVAKLDENTERYYFEGALNTINKAIINNEKLKLESLLSNFDDKTQKALEHYYTVASSLKQNAVRLGINHINFPNIEKMLDNTYLKVISITALRQLHTHLNQSPSPAAEDADTQNDEALARAAQQTIVSPNSAAGAVDTSRDEEIARELLKLNTDPTSPAAGAVDTSRDQEIVMAIALDNRDNVSLDDKIKMANTKIEEYERNLKNGMSHPKFQLDIFLLNYETPEEIRLVTIIHDRLQKNQQ